MKKLLFLICFLPSVLFAGKVKTADGIVYEYDDSFSFKDFTGRKFESGEIRSGTTIYSSVFISEVPNTEIFPVDMVNVTFFKCNLDNIKIPNGNNLIECSNLIYQVQNDLEDWIVDKKDLKPIAPVLKEKFKELGISENPKDIPATKLEEPITEAVKSGKVTPKPATPIQEEPAP